MEFNEEHHAAKSFVFEVLRDHVSKYGMKIDAIDEQGYVLISQGAEQMKINLNNLAKNYQRDQDRIAISELIRSLLASEIEMPNQWEQAKNDIYISLYPNQFDFRDSVYQKITSVFGKVYAHSGKRTLTWVTTHHLKKWNITHIDLDIQACFNADRLLANTNIVVDKIMGHKVGYIEANPSSLVAACLFAPSMKQKIKPLFGYPFYAIIPIRDMCLVFGQKDYAFFYENMGEIVSLEFQRSGYTITNELLMFSDKGVKTIRRYKV